MTYRGGFYDQQASSSSSRSDSSPNPDNVTIADGLWYSDTLILSSNSSLPNFRIGVPRKVIGDEYQTMNALGVGSNSLLLGTLAEQHHIASRSFSMWWGRDGGSVSATQDGIFVLGGYDQAKTLGRKFCRN